MHIHWYTQGDKMTSRLLVVVYPSHDTSNSVYER